jgi:GR25 family glycosyltransferase involved in LPS biosynthesis
VRAYVINLPEQKESVEVLRKSIHSTGSDIDLIEFDATTPDTIEEHLRTEFTYWDSRQYQWTWPKTPSENRFDMKTGLDMFAYTAADVRKKEACSISHMRLWDKCVALNEPIIIFEADAVMTRKFELDEVFGSSCVGLNDPRGTTRRASLFHEIVSSRYGLQRPPTVNSPTERAPQGLAGGSAYYITPQFATKLLEGIKVDGVWPNDAYICKELFPEIAVIYPYFTKVQGTLSTTTR